LTAMFSKLQMKSEPHLVDKVLAIAASNRLSRISFEDHEVVKEISTRLRDAVRLELLL